MERVISVSLGEVILKGKNRKSFVDKLIGQIQKAARPLGYKRIYKDMGKIYIECDEDKMEELMERIRHVFGIIYISPCTRVSRDLDSIKEGVLEELKYLDSSVKTFKAHTKRGDKNYPMESMELNRFIGGVVLKNSDLTVDVHNPDVFLYCDIKRHAYIYSRRIQGLGGLPRRTNGRGLLLLSGGIDSPVAGFLMAKRGVEIDAVHFHSYPFTSKRAEKKVVDLGDILTSYTGKINLYTVNLLPIQKEINKNCPQEDMTIISRRFMMRIAEKIAQEKEYNCIITGENLGQVASQTIHGLTVTNNITNRLIMRPLIGMDKVDIIDIAKKIGTYETSILPFEDCCTVFLPKHPNLKPTIEGIEKVEEPLDVDGLVQSAVDEMELIRIGG